VQHEYERIEEGYIPDEPRDSKTLKKSFQALVKWKCHEG